MGHSRRQKGLYLSVFFNVFITPPPSAWRGGSTQTLDQYWGSIDRVEPHHDQVIFILLEYAGTASISVVLLVEHGSADRLHVTCIPQTGMTQVRRQSVPSHFRRVKYKTFRAPFHHCTPRSGGGIVHTAHRSKSLSGGGEAIGHALA